MKLLYIANSRIPTEKAHGRQIMKMCECFAQISQVQLVLPTRKNIFSHSDPFVHYGIREDFAITRLFTWDPTFLLRGPAGWFIKIQMACFVVSLLFYLMRLKNREEYFFYTRDEYLLPLLQLFSKRVVWESHALPGRVEYLKKYLKRCHRIIVLTNQIKKDLVARGIAESAIMVSPDAVDLAIFDIKTSLIEAREQFQLPLDRKIMGYTGSFKTKGMDKGIATILDALRIYKDDQILFVAVGGNDDDIRYYKKTAKQIGVDSKVLFLGPVSQRELATYQKAFDVLLMPFPYTKHYAFYMSPLKMFEYMASGRPIITSNLPSVRDVLSENNAIFCHPDDPEDLAQKIAVALHDADLVATITKQALYDVSHYTWQARADAIGHFIIT